MSKSTSKRTKKQGISLPRSIHKLFPQVTSAVDSVKAISVSVNKKDCEEAKKLDPTNCALARAAKREYHADGVIIGLSSSYIIKDKKAIRFQTPESVRREIVSFDRHSDFEAGEYTLPPKSPSASFGSGYYEQHRNKSGGKNKNATRKVHKSVRVRILEKGSSKGE